MARGAQEKLIREDDHKVAMKKDSLVRYDMEEVVDSGHDRG